MTPDKFTEPSLESKTHATYTHKGIDTMFTRPRQLSNTHHIREEGPKPSTTLLLVKDVPAKEGSVTIRLNLALRRHHAK